MFKDESFDTLNIVSDLKEEKYVRDQLIQTKVISFEDKSCQSVLKADAELQTEFESILPQATRLKIDNSKHLSQFMLNVYPLVSEQLLANVRSRAFDGYEVDWEEAGENEEIEIVNKLQDKSLSEELTITCVDWNCTGSVIAASFGSLDHEAWCVHHAVIHIWNVDRINLNESKADKIIDTDCCVSSIAFNPKQPAILAGGDFSGKILIWDMGREENMLVAYTGKDVLSHQEEVTQIIWGNPKSTRSFELISSGSDGKILIWDFNQLKMKLTSVRKFLLTNESIPRSYRNGLFKNDLIIGISCFSLNGKKENELFLGTEGGGVFQCYTQVSKHLTKTFYNEQFHTPIINGFKGHSSSVRAISVSKNVDNIFATCSADMLHIYNSNNIKPLIEIEPVSGGLLHLEWSPLRSTVIAVSTSTGSVLIYELIKNTTAPLHVISVAKKACHALSFNKDRPVFLACGSNEKVLCVWKLTNSLGISTNDEELFYGTLSEE